MVNMLIWSKSKNDNAFLIEYTIVIEQLIVNKTLSKSKKEGVKVVTFYLK